MLFTKGEGGGFNINLFLKTNSRHKLKTCPLGKRADGYSTKVVIHGFYIG